MIYKKLFNRYLPLTLSVALLAGAGLVYLFLNNNPKLADAAWYNASWGYRKAITIDHNKVSGTASSTINSFPVLINVTDSDLKYTGSGGKVGRTDGLDMVFTQSDGTTTLSYEMEKYASTTGETIAWVKIPILSAVTDTTIFLYFGNSGSSDQSSSTNVWDSNFKIVQHLPNGSTLTANDSTSNAVNGTISTPTATTGQIGGGANFNGSSDVISFANTTSFATTGASFSASFWGYISTFASNSYQHAWTIKSNGAGSRPWEMTVSNQSAYAGLLIGSSSDWAVVKTDNTPATGVWHYYVATYNGSGASTMSNFKLYQDGVLQNNASPLGFSALTNTTQIGPTSGGGSNFWQGKLDEMRFSSTERNFDWIKTEFNNQVSPSSFYSYGTLSVQTSSPSSVTSGAGASWYNASWSYRKPITIDHNKVSGVASSTLNSFPVLISVTDSDLKYTGSGGKMASSTAGDLLFTASDGTTKLDFETEKYSSTTGETIAWVRVPILSAVTDTTIYIYFGNNSATNQQNITGVWESSYKGVWHLKDGNTLTLTDSTSNGGNGSNNNGVTATAGKVGGAANFTAASSQYVSVTDNDRYSFGNGTTDSPFTWSTWVYMPNTGTVAGNFIEKYVGFPGGEYALAPSNTNILYSFLIDTSSGGYIGRSVSNLSNYIPNNTWALVTWTYSGGATNASNKIYINGVQRDDGNFSSGAYTAMENSIYDVNFAKQQGLTGGYLNGKMDEVRLYAAERTADWIKTEYNNQNSPSTFYAYGALQVQNRSGASVGFNSRGWYNKSWAYRMPITIDHTKVASSTQPSLNNFPVLISVTSTNLKTTGNGGGVASNSGDDILFTDADGATKLPHEIETYASSTGQLIAWVKVPVLSSTVDNVIYIYYGNSSASSQQNPTGVWDNNFTGVYHLKDGTTLNQTDSTANAYNGTTVGSLGATTGQVDGGMSVSNGGTNYSDTGNGQFGITSSFTIQTWAYTTNWTASMGAIGQGLDGFGSGWNVDLYVSGTGSKPACATVFGTTVTGSDNPFTNSTWHLITCSYDSSTGAHKLYQDGVLVASGTATNSGRSSTKGIVIGRTTNGNTFNGTLDEVQISNAVRSADWIKTEYNNQNSPSTFVSFGSQQTQSSATSSSSWYNTSWGYRKAITIDHNKVSNVNGATLSNFPMLFNITDSDLKYTGSGGKVASSTAGDILFTDSDGITKLNFEIEKYASTTGETVAWVQVPTLSPASDKIIYIYFGNASATNQQNASGVWDSNFKGVWHLPETTGHFFDSTSNANNSTTETLTARGVTGQVGLAPRFSSSTPDKIVLPNIPLTTALTLSSWIYPTETTNYARIIAKAHSINAAPYINYSLVFDTSNPPKVIFGLAIGGTGYDLTSNKAFLFNRWQNVTATYDGSNTRIFINGVEDVSASRTGTIDTVSQQVEIGHNTVFDPSNDRQSFTGTIDESRISNVARSADWIKTEYNNQTSPSTFYSYGALSTNGRQDSSGVTQPAIKSRGGVRFR